MGIVGFEEILEPLCLHAPAYALHGALPRTSRDARQRCRDAERQRDGWAGRRVLRRLRWGLRQLERNRTLNNKKPARRRVNSWSVGARTRRNDETVILIS